MRACVRVCVCVCVCACVRLVVCSCLVAGAAAAVAVLVLQSVGGRRCVLALELVVAVLGCWESAVCVCVCVFGRLAEFVQLHCCHGCICLRGCRALWVCRCRRWTRSASDDRLVR